METNIESKNEQIAVQIKEIKRIANNALYFDDNNDYGTALWQILDIVAPELFKDDSEPSLSYIEST